MPPSVPADHFPAVCSKSFSRLDVLPACSQAISSLRKNNADFSNHLKNGPFNGTYFTPNSPRANSSIPESSAKLRRPGRSILKSDSRHPDSHPENRIPRIVLRQFPVISELRDAVPHRFRNQRSSATAFIRISVCARGPVRSVFGRPSIPVTPTFATARTTTATALTSCTLAADRRSAERSAVLNGRKKTVIAGAITCGLERPRSGWVARSGASLPGQAVPLRPPLDAAAQRRFRGRNRHRTMVGLRHSRRHADPGASVPDGRAAQTPANCHQKLHFGAWLNTGVSYQNALTPCAQPDRPATRLAVGVPTFQWL